MGNDDDSDFSGLEDMPRRSSSSSRDLHVRVALLEQATGQVKKELHDINKNINKLVWAVITAVLVGILNMVIGQKDIRNVKVGYTIEMDAAPGLADTTNRLSNRASNPPTL